MRTGWRNCSGRGPPAPIEYNLSPKSEVFMTRPAGPQVLTEGARTFIRVPSDAARSVHTYLRRHGVVCAPPGPCYTGLDVIELGSRTDAKAVRALLEDWA